jgi:hypothetical protein
MCYSIGVRSFTRPVSTTRELMMRPEIFGIVFLLMGCSKPDCSPELFDRESQYVVPDVNEYLTEEGEQPRNCEDLCLDSPSELLECEVTGRSEPTDVQWETLERLTGVTRDGAGGGAGAGGTSPWPDPGVLELLSTYDRSSSKPECDNED